MNINEFAKEVAKEEGGRKQVSIAQIKEIIGIVNGMTKGVLYALIKADCVETI